MANRTEVKTYLKYAEIANAAYAFEGLYTDHKDNGEKYTLEEYLEEKNSFSTAEAKEFASNYKYIFKDKKGDKHDFSSYQYFQTKYENGSPEGFKAALLKSKDGYVLATAGTDGIKDLGDIESDYNLAEGTVCDQYKYMVEYINYLKKDVLPDGAKMTVAGHSLGGFLAQDFTAHHSNFLKEINLFKA